VYVQNYAYHEKQRRPVEFTVELEVNGEIQRFEGIISPKLETGRHSDYPVTRFTVQPGLRPLATGEPDPYAKYDDALIRKQWTGVLSSEDQVLPLESPEDIIEVIVGTIGLTERKVDLEGYLDALDAAHPSSPAVEQRQRDRRQEIARALAGLSLSQLPVADVSL
jgi:hypothetical protein